MGRFANLVLYLVSIFLHTCTGAQLRRPRLASVPIGRSPNETLLASDEMLTVHAQLWLLPCYPADYRLGAWQMHCTATLATILSS